MDSIELRKHIIEVLHELFEARLITPTGGNVSSRLPNREGILITPTADYKGGLTPEDIVQVDLDGKAIDISLHPSVETRLHLEVYALRKKVGAIVHTHAPMATILGLCKIPIPPITVDAAPFVGIPIVPFALSGTPDEIENIAGCLGSAPALLLQNHGLLTVGRDLRQAADRAFALEEVARTVITIHQLGVEPAVMPEREAALLKMVLGG
jgi:ribulose-5-phosphate 4-epimerase/fuculose-1-phosphate aldolase